MFIEKTRTAISESRAWAVAKTAAVVAVATAGASANAAAIDVTTVVTDIAAQAAPIALVGSAVLLVYLGVKAFKWVRAALS